MPINTTATNSINLSDIQAGDYVASSGDRAIARLSGHVVKANRVTLVLQTSYFDKPMTLKVRRDDLRGRIKVLRDGVVYEGRGAYAD